MFSATGGTSKSRTAMLAFGPKLRPVCKGFREVYPAVKEDGITNQRVTIHYNCIGAFEMSDRWKIPERDILMETRKGVALSYVPAQIDI